MGTFNRQLKPGDWVEVRTETEILATLDEMGTLDGLPFMPEMMEFSGRCFRVQRRAEKTCCEVPAMQMRSFVKNDVVLLEGLRCAGINHGGCQNGCMIFWKEAWLRRVTQPAPLDKQDYSSRDALRARLRTDVGQDQFFCQATQLVHATRLLPRIGRILKCVRDIRTGTYRIGEAVRWMVRPAVRKSLRAFRGEWPSGSQTRTPTEALGLQSGEWVEVKSVDEIAGTLDSDGKNRGLHFSEDMAAFCGRKFRVKSRLDRMIVESTGQMKEVKNTVILEDVTCGCPFTIGGCPRSLYQYWREIWLKRTPAPGQLSPDTSSDNSSQTDRA